jgi:prephenate dehydrogenase
VNRIAIVGLGMMGGSLGLALRRSRPHLEIVAVVAKPSDVTPALSSGAVTAASADISLCGTADLVVIATPISAVEGIMCRLSKVRPRPLVTDLSSIKRPLLEWAHRHLPVGGRFLGGHPMAGKYSRARHGFSPRFPDRTPRRSIPGSRQCVVSAAGSFSWTQTSMTGGRPW